MLSMSGDRLDYAPEDIGRIALIGQYAVGKAFCLAEEAQEREKDAALTLRERDILRWACEGKTDWEIGKILGISRHSADKYMRRLKEKLNATTRTHLVAQAFRLRIL